MNEQARRGRLRLMYQSLAVLGLNGAIIVMTLSRLPAPLDSPAGQTAILTRVVRFLLTGFLLFMVYRGSNIAKWIAIVLFGAAVVIGLRSITVPLIGVILVFYSVYALLLLASKDVAAFLEYQRRRY